MMDIFSFKNKLQKVEDLKKYKNSSLWIDCTDITQEEAAKLQDAFGLHALTAEDLVNTGIRVKVEEFPSYIFCAFYGLHKKGELVEVDFILGKNFIISNHKTDLAVTTKLKEDTKKLESLLKKGTEFVLHKILDKEIDDVFVVLEDLSEKLDALEERVAQHPDPKLLTKIYQFKRTTSMLKRTFLAQREKTSFLAKNEYVFIREKAVPYFRDIYDHSIRVSDTVEIFRESISNTFDVYMSSVSNNMNEVMKVLSIIATIALPLTVVSGVYGTNFTILPGALVPYGFWIMIFVMILMSVGMIYFFRKKGWF